MVPTQRSRRGITSPARLTLRLATLLAVLVTAVPATATERPERMTVIRAGTVITGTGDVYSPGMVIIDEGKIRLVGTGLEVPRGARVIEAPRETVVAGWVHTQSRFQLPRFRREGSHASRSAKDELYFEDIEFEHFVEHGFVVVAFEPTGGGIPGRAALVSTGEPKHLDEPGYIPVEMSNPGRDKRVLEQTLANAKKAVEARAKAKEEFEKKEAEEQKKAEEAAKKAKEEGKPAPEPRKPGEFKAPNVDADLVPWMPFFDDAEKEKRPTLFVKLGRASDLIHFDQILDEYEEIEDHVIYQLLPGRFYSDYFEVVDLLGERKARVLAEPQLDRMPYTVNLYNLPAKLVAAGCTVAFHPEDSLSGFDRYRSSVAELVRTGLDRDAALAALGKHPAEWLGLGDRLGTIEKEKEASFVFLDGDPLDPISRITRVLVNGQTVWEREE